MARAPKRASGSAAAYAIRRQLHRLGRELPEATRDARQEPNERSDSVAGILKRGEPAFDTGERADDDDPDWSDEEEAWVGWSPLRHAEEVGLSPNVVSQRRRRLEKRYERVRREEHGA